MHKSNLIAARNRINKNLTRKGWWPNSKDIIHTKLSNRGNIVRLPEKEEPFNLIATRNRLNKSIRDTSSKYPRIPKSISNRIDIILPPVIPFNSTRLEELGKRYKEIQEIKKEIQDLSDEITNVHQQLGRSESAVRGQASQYQSNAFEEQRKKILNDLKQKSEKLVKMRANLTKIEEEMSPLLSARIKTEGDARVKKNINDKIQEVIKDITSRNIYGTINLNAKLKELKELLDWRDNIYGIPIPTAKTEFPHWFRTEDNADREQIQEDIDENELAQMIKRNNPSGQNMLNAMKHFKDRHIRRAAVRQGMTSLTTKRTRTMTPRNYLDPMELNYIETKWQKKMEPYTISSLEANSLKSQHPLTDKKKNNRGPLINLRAPREEEVNLLKFEPTKAGLSARSSELSGLFNGTVQPGAISSLQANAIRAAGNSNNLRGGMKKSRRNRKAKKATRKANRKH